MERVQADCRVIDRAVGVLAPPELQVGEILHAVTEEGGAHDPGHHQAQPQRSLVAAFDAPFGEEHGEAAAPEDEAHDDAQRELGLFDAGRRPLLGRGPQEEVAPDQAGEDRGLGHDQADHSPPRRWPAFAANRDSRLRDRKSRRAGDNAHARSTSVRHSHHVIPTTPAAAPMTPTSTAWIINPTNNTPIPSARMNGR